MSRSPSRPNSSNRSNPSPNRPGRASFRRSKRSERQRWRQSRDGRQYYRLRPERHPVWTRTSTTGRACCDRRPTRPTTAFGGPATRDRRQRGLEAADVILSKGQGNYELCRNVDAPIYVLFMMKCDVVTADVGVPEGSIGASAPAVDADGD
ncbi:ARMT1-like domain-containing protein [Halorhabdus utahensis]|uniref:ARMT1-like domain-containing protein n=1 Tax=Halorhabdus utahensis TaxID=146826 RepID=UPI00315CB719